MKFEQKVSNNLLSLSNESSKLLMIHSGIYLSPSNNNLSPQSPLKLSFSPPFNRSISPSSSYNNLNNTSISNSINNISSLLNFDNYDCDINDSFNILKYGQPWSSPQLPPPQPLHLLQIKPQHNQNPNNYTKKSKRNRETSQENNYNCKLKSKKELNKKLKKSTYIKSSPNNIITVNNVNSKERISCNIPHCIVCEKGKPPSFENQKPIWSHVIYVALYSLNLSFEQLEIQGDETFKCKRSNTGKRFFRLDKDIFSFIENHWDKICFKEKQSNWRHIAGMTLSHYPLLFENGYKVFNCTGYWGLSNYKNNPYSVNFYF